MTTGGVGIGDKDLFGEAEADLADEVETPSSDGEFEFELLEFEEILIMVEDFR
jgi:hypothetical protein